MRVNDYDAAERSDTRIDDREEIVVPVVEERIVPEVRQVDLGEVRVHKHVEAHEETVQLPVTRDDVVIQRVEINQPIETPAKTRQEGEWLVIPVMKEVVVVQKQLMLVEEVRIKRSQVHNDRVVRETVRREHVEIEDNRVGTMRPDVAAAAPSTVESMPDTDTVSAGHA